MVSLKNIIVVICFLNINDIFVWAWMLRVLYIMHCCWLLTFCPFLRVVVCFNCLMLDVIFLMHAFLVVLAFYFSVWVTFLFHFMQCGYVWFIVYCRLLATFAFHLSLNWELPFKRVVRTDTLRESVRSMLITHHLFSWDL